MPNKPLYLTTTLPYVNAAPHIGFALELVQADILARYYRLLGHEVVLNTGTDEHGVKIYQAAMEAGETPQAYADRFAAKFRELQSWLNLTPDLRFIRTTDPQHEQAAQAFWKICDQNGYIYKKEYEVKYCVGCELEKTDSELEGGRCPIHPNRDLELIKEENYFFKFSEFQSKLLKLYEDNPNFVAPSSRLNEIKAFVSRGLQDFSISRLKSKMPWGVAVPGDDTQVMYVWFDALVNYISTIGWPNDKAEFEQWWPVIQFAGKDNLRQQSAMWQAMLMAANLPPSKQILIHGFINVGGQKMSKSLGNVINPVKLVEEYGVDALRYYLARHTNPFEDSDFTLEKFKEAYNANLANGLGNLVARVMKLSEKYLETGTRPVAAQFPQEYTEALEKFEYNRALDYVWQRIGLADQKITDTEPFKLVKTEIDKGKQIILELTQELYVIARLLNPFLPDTSEKIKQAVKDNNMPEALFPRKE